MRFFQTPKKVTAKTSRGQKKKTRVTPEPPEKPTGKKSPTPTPLLPTQPLPSHQGAAPYAGIFPFVRFLRYQLYLPLCLTHLACKEKGYHAVSLLLILLCRPPLHCDSLNQFRSLLAQRFIQRVFNLSYGKQRGASVDILYDLFEKLDPDLIETSFYRHLQHLRRRGLIGKHLRAYFDSTIIEKSPNSTFEKAAWITIRKISYYGFKLFIIIDIETKSLVYVRFATVDQTDAKELVPAVQKLHSLGFRLTHLGFDRGFWSGENFKFLDRHNIYFFTVLKNYQKEHQDLIRKVTSRTAGRQRIKPGVWITEIPPISINTYFKTKTVRCIVVRQKGCLPWAIITNDPDLSPAQIVELYYHRNLVEKVIEELKNDYAIQKLPRKKFTENTCYVLLTLWSYNLLNDYNLSVLQDKELCFQQLKSLRPILFGFTAIAIYSRFAIYLRFESTHPLQDKLLNFNDL